MHVNKRYLSYSLSRMEKAFGSQEASISRKGDLWMDRHETAISAAIRDVVIFVVDNLYNRNEVKKKKDKCVFWLY